MTAPDSAGRRAAPIAPGVWQLDLRFQRVPETVAAYLYTSPEGHTLVETGPGSTLGALRAAIVEVGARIEDVRRLVVTHIHLDHAGAAGTLLRELPAARLLVHPAGAPHMVDPAKLLASATRIYGERMDALWGAFEACPADRVETLEDGAAIVVGEDRTLRVHWTPGHATHHVALHDETTGDVLTGDVGGVRIPGAQTVRPPTPPPDIDLEAWHASVARIRALAPRRLLLTHFGGVTDVARHLDELEQRLDRWAAWVRDHAARGETSPEMATALRTALDAELVARGEEALAPAYELATPSGMTVDGLLRYWKKRGDAA